MKKPLVHSTSTVHRDAAALTTKVDDDLVILGENGSNYVALDTIGCRIWDMIADPQPVGTLCRVLAESHLGAPRDIARDTLVFLNDLAEEELVHVVCA